MFQIGRRVLRPPLNLNICNHRPIDARSRSGSGRSQCQAADQVYSNRHITCASYSNTLNPRSLEIYNKSRDHPCLHHQRRLWEKFFIVSTSLRIETPGPESLNLLNVNIIPRLFLKGYKYSGWVTNSYFAVSWSI